jgi:hypothetical protein
MCTDMRAFSSPSRAQLAVAGLSAALTLGAWTGTAQRAAVKATPRTVTARGPLVCLLLQQRAVCIGRRRGDGE